MKRTKIKVIEPVSSESDLENLINKIELKIDEQLTIRHHIKNQREFIFKKFNELTNKIFNLNEIPALIYYFTGGKSNVKQNFLYLIANPICFYLENIDEDTISALSYINKYNKVNNYKFEEGCKKIKEIINTISVINKPSKYCKILIDWEPIFV